jgi:hypothetical protein
MSTGDRKVFGVVLPLETFLDMARDLGETRGRSDRDANVYNDSPLSGEWSGESVRELLGDILDAVGDEYADDVCDAYETGYAGVFDDVDTVSVCVDCVYVLTHGRDQYYEESPDDTRERPAGVFPYLIEAAWVTGSVSTFVKYPCECCGSKLAGERHGVIVWDSPDSAGA